jgi:hypothetical protein
VGLKDKVEEEPSWAEALRVMEYVKCEPSKIGSDRKCNGTCNTHKSLAISKILWKTKKELDAAASTD